MKNIVRRQAHISIGAALAIGLSIGAKAEPAPHHNPHIGSAMTIKVPVFQPGQVLAFAVNPDGKFSRTGNIVRTIMIIGGPKLTNDTNIAQRMIFLDYDCNTGEQSVMGSKALTYDNRIIDEQQEIPDSRESLPGLKGLICDPHKSDVMHVESVDRIWKLNRQFFPSAYTHR